MPRIILGDELEMKMQREYWYAKLSSLKIILIASCVLLLSSCGGPSGDGGWGGKPTLNSITVTPASLTVTYGKTATLSATGTYADGSTADLTSQVAWIAAAPGTASVGSGGVVSGSAVGTTAITAKLNEITSSPATIIVTSATLSSLAITPSTATLAIGSNVSLSAIGTYSDGSTANLTTQVNWASEVPTTASVGVHTGVVSAAAAGSTIVTATVDDAIVATANITVTNAVLTNIILTPISASLKKGASTSLSATGTYSDGSSADITTHAIWISTNSAIAAVGANTGIVVGAAVGSTTVIAKMNDISSPTAAITVTPATLTGIFITPEIVAITKGSTQNFTATGTYSDGTAGNISGSVTWSSANTAVASVNASGTATGLSVNTTGVTAVLGDVTSNSATLNVNASIGGTLSWLAAGNSISMSNNGTDSITVGTDGAFAFANSLANGATYNLSITSVPASQNCTSLNGSGIVGGDNISNVYVFCGMLYTGQWASTGLVSTRVGHTATLLSNSPSLYGKVLVAGGTTSSGVAATALIYDMATGQTTSLATSNQPRTNHTATLLPNGNVLLVGGVNPSGGTRPPVEIYNSSSGMWAVSSYTPMLGGSRSMHTSTLLNNGKVLSTGGKFSTGYSLPITELYDSTSGTWLQIMESSPQHVARYGHTATMLPNGKVLVVGGKSVNGDSSLGSAELYDPVSGQWIQTGGLHAARWQHTATLLPNGKVLVAGGEYAGGTAELYDSDTGQWTATTNNLSAQHQQHTATLLPSGKVLVAGGSAYGVVCELFDPATGQWTTTGNLITARYAHTATLLPSGKVFVWGGTTPVSASTELYW